MAENNQLTGTTIKDTWTKPRGRVEVEEGGGSAGVGWRDGEKRHTTCLLYTSDAADDRYKV